FCDTESKLDGAWPAQFGAEMNVETHQYPGQPLRHQAETAVLHQGDAAGFEIGRVYRIDDVTVGIKISETDIVRKAIRIIVEERLGRRAGRCVHELVLRHFDVLTAQLSKPG